MKYYRPADDIVPLIPLCKYFRLDARELNQIQKTQVLYIYKRLLEWLPDTDMGHILAEVDRLRIELGIRGKQRSLYHIFHYCQAKYMAQHGGYDVKTLRPPKRPFTDIYY